MYFKVKIYALSLQRYENTSFSWNIKEGLQYWKLVWNQEER